MVPKGFQKKTTFRYDLTENYKELVAFSLVFLIIFGDFFLKITNKHYGNLMLSTDLEMAGLLSGDLIVSYGCTALVSGIVAGRIFVESGGRLLLNGSALNGITNRGGIVEIYGVVDGGIEEISGETVISSRAVVR